MGVVSPLLTVALELDGRISDSRMLWFFEAAFMVSACTELLDCVAVQINWLNLIFSAMEFYFLVES